MKSLSISIIETLCYHEIFSYPMRVSELRKYLLHDKLIGRQQLILELKSNSRMHEDKNGYVFLRGSSKLIDVRAKRTVYSSRKHAKARNVINILKHIPTLKLIGISGSLSMNNAKVDDDIDLFFITSHHTVWISRFLVTCVLLVLGNKRSRGKAIAKDRICPNMFLSERALSIPLGSRNIYTAHEVSQLKPVYAADNMYQKFLTANAWVLSLLPHAFIPDMSALVRTRLSSYLLLPLEFCMFIAQYLYMKKGMTREQVNLNYALFHPLQTDISVQAIYALKVGYWVSSFRREKLEKNSRHLASLN